MDLFSPQEHLCYVRCTYCNTVLAVGVPWKRMMDTVTVKCGHCNSLSYLNPRPFFQSLNNCSNHLMASQGSSNEHCKGLQLLPSSSASSEETMSLKAANYVAKPPEKKQRLSSPYNCFMRDEIQRVKAANPQMPHRQAFSTAAKNWAKCDPRGLFGASTDKDASSKPMGFDHEETNGALLFKSFDVFKEMEGTRR